MAVRWTKILRSHLLAGFWRKGYYIGMASRTQLFGVFHCLLVSFVAVQIACQGTDNLSQASSNSGGTSPFGGATGGTTASPSDIQGGSQGISGGSGGSTALYNQGQILIMNSSQVANGTLFGTAQADPMFRTNVGVCPSQTFGDCRFTPNSTCNSSYNGTYVSAGIVTVTSAATSMVRAVNASINPNADNTYSPGDLGTAYVGSEQVHVAASGATVPAFSADITVPLVLLVNSPSPDANGNLTASTTSDLIIKFDRGAAGKTALVLASNSTGTLDCEVPSESGQMTIQAAALATFGSGNQFAIYTSGMAPMAVGGQWTIEVGAIMYAMTEDRAHPIVVTIQ